MSGTVGGEGWGGVEGRANKRKCGKRHRLHLGSSSRSSSRGLALLFFSNVLKSLRFSLGTVRGGGGGMEGCEVVAEWS
jgi:hypothetical protein